MKEKHWRYVLLDGEGNFIKGIYTCDARKTASQICWIFEIEGYQVLTLSCLASFPFMNFIMPERRKKHNAEYKLCSRNSNC